MNEVLTKFIGLAQKNTNILAIGLEGSQNNSHVIPDAWTDTDVTLFTHDPEKEDGEWWIQQFGQPVIVQRLQSTNLFGPSHHLWHIWLTRYEGTLRIDLKIASAADEAAYVKADHLNAIVWRRQTGELEPHVTSPESHFVSQPSPAEFEAHITEFYWCAGNVAKGLARKNLVYANEQLNQLVRPELLKMWAYYFTVKKQGKFDAGVSDKFVWVALTPEERDELAQSYDQTTLAKTRVSLRKLLKLYQQLLHRSAQVMAYEIPAFVAPAEKQLLEWLA
ncbi:aminoglycoside 6-adenylyltransferase [Pediococcus siamensis]|uniref:aminoglycoside 6-adenylyltransferase n=1 Tax=Pediococcus siamensis TaxID=381829 RepID=UPI00399F6D87